MSAGRYNIVIEPGATYPLPLTWRQPNGDPVSLAGCTVRLRIWASLRDDPLVNVTAAGDTTGAVTLTVSASATTALAAIREGVYAVEVEHGGGVVTRLLDGAVDIRPIGTAAPRRTGPGGG